MPKVATFAALIATTALLLSGCSGQSFPAAKPITTADVGVQMHMWPFDSLATECSTLAKDGYSWVLVSPPEEDIMGQEWWDHYQPVSYKIGSSLGTEKQFKNMVTSCNKAGVQVVVDVVLNHMTADRTGGQGFLGSKYTKYDYPGLYTNTDFHTCPTGVDQITDYSNVVEVQQCELLGLADLNTGSGSVRDKEANFLKSMRAMGVAGFRIDAAKHIAASELKQITDQLPSDTFWVDEVIGDIPPQADYYAFGNVFSFDWVTQMHNIFGSSGLLGGSADANYFKLLSPSDKTVTMVSNHDTERNGSAITYNWGPQYLLASAFTLAVPYGKPMMYSSYAFNDNDAGPLTDPSGFELPASCVANPGPNHASYPNGQWVCQHNWAGIVGMIAFHKAVGNADFANIFQDKDAYGFGRGNKGYILFNTGTSAYSGKVQTGLAAGNYTDRIGGGTITVNTDGTIDAKLSSWSALAIDVKGKN